MINICRVELDGLGNIQVKMCLGDKLAWTSEEKSEIEVQLWELFACRW